MRNDYKLMSFFSELNLVVFNYKRKKNGNNYEYELNFEYIK